MARRVRLRDGAEVAVRPIAPEDRDELRQEFERLSPESRYRRFFSPVSQLSERELRYLTEVDHHDHEALIALEQATGRGVGVARFVRTGEDEAEPAVVVADDWQGRGVATALLSELADRAREEGIARFRAPVLAGNEGAIRVLRSLGEGSRRPEGTTVEVTIELAPAGAEQPRLGRALRAAADGTLIPGLTFLQRLARGPRRPPPDRAALRNTIVVGTDGSDREFVRRAGELARALGAEVELVTARRPLLDDAAALRGALERLAEGLRRGGVPAGVHVRAGSPAAAIVDLAEETAARLVVVGATSAETAVARLGSVADAVARQAPCDVLMLR